MIYPFILNKSLEQSKNSWHIVLSMLFYLVKLNASDNQISLQRTYRLVSILTIGIVPLWYKSAHRKIGQAS